MTTFVIWLAPSIAQAATASFPDETITNADATQTDRLNQTGPSTCTTPKTPQVHGDGFTRHRDLFTFTNVSPSPLCVTVTLDVQCDSGFGLISATYATAAPADLTTGYLGDRGTSASGPASYGFTVPANTDFVVTVTELNPNYGCSDYDLAVTAPFAPNSLQRLGGLSASDPTQTARLVRTGAASKCAQPKTVPGVYFPTTQFPYDSYRFVNNGSTASCVTAWAAAPQCQYGTSLSAAYVDSFDRSDIRNNYLGDAGNSASAHSVLSYSFTVPAGHVFVVTFAGTDTGPCEAYQLSVDGEGIAAAPPPDRDGDGVPDGRDACPSVAATTTTGCPARARDTTKPLLTALSLSRTRFRAASSGPSAATATGTSVSYTLSEAAVVKFRIKRGSRGRRVNGRCVKRTRSNRKARRCTRYKTLRGSIIRRGTASVNRFVLRGRLRGRRLKPGRYRLVGVATDLAGNASKARRRGFRVVRR